MTYNEPAPKGFTWPGGATLALSIVVNVEEGAERSILKGDKGPEPVDELGAVPRKPIRVHGNESNYQYGIKRGAPRVLKILDDGLGSEKPLKCAGMNHVLTAIAGFSRRSWMKTKSGNSSKKVRPRFRKPADVARLATSRAICIRI